MASPATLAKRKRLRVSCCHRHVHDDFFIYLAKSRSQAEARFRAFRARWRREYGGVVWRLERYLPELLFTSIFRKS